MECACKVAASKYFPFIILLTILLISIILRTYPYLINNHMFEVGFDTGYYENVFLRYTESTYWSKLPAYPQMVDKEAFPMEPGLYIVLSFVYMLGPQDMNLFFRYFLPSLFGVLIPLGAFMLMYRHSQGNAWLACLAAALVAISYVQVDAINASYYRQILSSFVLLIALWKFDLIYGTGGRRGLIFMGFILATTLAFHRAGLFIFMMILVASMLLNQYRGLTDRNKNALKVLLLVALFSLPMLLPTVEYQLNTVLDIISNSQKGIAQQFSDGINYMGGGVPEYFSRGAVLESYIYYFPFLTACGLLGAMVSIKEQQRRPLLLGLIILLVYIGFWFTFGNRLLLVMDLLMIFFCCFALMYIQGLERLRRRKKANVTVVIIVILLLVFPANFVVNAQENKVPIINENLEGADWLADNVPTEGTLIFAPDYLSVALLQMGYRVAMLDYDFSINWSHPVYVDETFMVQAPSNITYLDSFFATYPWAADLDIYVIWGTRETYAALANTLIVVPIDAYEDSPWFELQYSGYGEILMVYRYSGSVSIL